LELRRRCCKVLQDRLLVSYSSECTVAELAVMHALRLHSCATLQGWGV
jgi:hypothetical protein